MHIGKTAGLVFASGKSDLELPAEVLRVAVTQEEFRAGPGIGRHVECLGPAHAGKGAGGHVTDGIAAGFAGCDAHRGQSVHEIGRIVDVDVMQLDVLARGNVQNTIRILLGKLGQHIQLIRGQAPERNLDPLHPRCVPHRIRPLDQVSAGKLQDLRIAAVEPFAVIVTLAVNTAAQAGFGENGVVDLVLFPQFDLRGEYVHLPAHFVGYAIRENFLPGCRFRHGNVSW